MAEYKDGYSEADFEFNGTWWSNNELLWEDEVNCQFIFKDHNLLRKILVYYININGIINFTQNSKVIAMFRTGIL